MRFIGNIGVIFVFFLFLELVLTDSDFDNTGVRILFKVYDECADSKGFSTCLKKKAITFLDRLGRMEKLSLIDGINLVKSNNALPLSNTDAFDLNHSRAIEEKDEVLNKMLLDKAGYLLGSRTLEISVPKITQYLDEERALRDGSLFEGGSGGGGGGHGGGGGGGGGGLDFGDGGGGGGGRKKGSGGGGGKMKNMMGGMMMAIAAKLAALIPVAIAGLFLLAGKALITAKIALLISGIIALKKLFAAKNKHQSSTHIHASPSGGGGGWQPSGGGSSGGWDKRSIVDAQKMAYQAYKQA